MKQAAFAKLHNVSRKTVTMWKSRSWLVFAGDEIDVEASNAQLKKYRIDRPQSVTQAVTQESQGNKSGNKASAKPRASKPAADSTPAIEIQDGESVEEAAERLVSEIDFDMSRDEALRIKEVYLALLNRLQYEQRIGSLVEMTLARSVIFDEFRAVRDAWLNWPTRVGPLLAADLGLEADRVTEALTEHVHKQIASLGEQPQGNFEE